MTAVWSEAGAGAGAVEGELPVGATAGLAAGGGGGEY